MSQRRQKHLIWVGWLVALVALAAAAWWRVPGGRRGAEPPGATTPTASGGALAELGTYGDVPAFALVSQTGDSVHLADLRGRAWIGDFIFTNCASTCPMMSAQLQKLNAALGDEPGIRFVSFSVDPKRDTPARLADYARGYGATPERWLFLTGDDQAVRRLARDGFHLPVEEPSPEDLARGAEAVLHSTRLVLVDARGRIRGYYDGTDAAAVKQLGEDVRRLASSAVP